MGLLISSGRSIWPNWQPHPRQRNSLQQEKGSLTMGWFGLEEGHVNRAPPSPPSCARWSLWRADGGGAADQVFLPPPHLDPWFFDKMWVRNGEELDWIPHLCCPVLAVLLKDCPNLAAEEPHIPLLPLLDSVRRDSGVNRAPDLWQYPHLTVSIPPWWKGYLPQSSADRRFASTEYLVVTGVSITSSPGIWYVTFTPPPGYTPVPGNDPCYGMCPKSTYYGTDDVPSPGGSWYGSAPCGILI